MGAGGPCTVPLSHTSGWLTPQQCGLSCLVSQECKPSTIRYWGEGGVHLHTAPNVTVTSTETRINLYGYYHVLYQDHYMSARSHPQVKLYDVLSSPMYRFNPLVTTSTFMAIYGVLTGPICTCQLRWFGEARSKCYMKHQDIP